MWPQGTGSLGDSHSCLSSPASSLTPLLPAVVYPVLHTLPRQPEAWEKGHCSPPSLLPPQGRAWGESIPEPEGQEKGGGEGERGDAHLPSSCRVLSIVLGPLKVPFCLILRLPCLSQYQHLHLAQPTSSRTGAEQQLDAEVCLGSGPVSLSLFSPLSRGGLCPPPLGPASERASWRDRPDLGRCVGHLG